MREKTLKKFFFSSFSPSRIFSCSVVTTLSISFLFLSLSLFFLFLFLRTARVVEVMSSQSNGTASGRTLRSRGIEKDKTPGSPSSTTAVLNGKVGSAPTAEQVHEAREAHATLIEAQNTKFDHRYGHVDMRDEQIIGGGKKNALQRYSPGIVISEKGREQDKKLDEHYE